MYGQEVAVTTFPPNLSFSDDDLTRNSRAAARQRVGIPDNVFVQTKHLHMKVEYIHIFCHCNSLLYYDITGIYGLFD